MKIATIAKACLLGSIVLVLPAYAPSDVQQSESIRCAPRHQVTKLLADTYQEKQSGLGLVNDEAVFELFVSPSGTWTAIVSDVSGVSCVIGSGEGWQGVTVLAQQS